MQRKCCVTRAELGVRRGVRKEGIKMSTGERGEEQRLNKEN